MEYNLQFLRISVIVVDLLLSGISFKVVAPTAVLNANVIDASA